MFVKNKIVYFLFYVNTSTPKGSGVSIPIMTLPEPIRPKTIITFPCLAVGTAESGKMVIRPTGVVEIQGTASWIHAGGQGFWRI